MTLSDAPAFAAAAPEPVVQIQAPAMAEPAWHDALEAARMTADAGTLRAETLEVLNSADDASDLAESIELLGWVGTDDDVELLESIVWTGGHLRDPAIEALGRIGSERAVDLLLSLSERPDPLLRHRALAALGVTENPSARPRLQRGLDDHQDRTIAATALGRLGGPGVAAVLTQRLHQGPGNDAHAIASALARMDDPAARVALHNTLRFGAGSQRIAAMHALAEVSDPQLYDVLSEGLRSGSVVARAEAATALGTLGDARAVPLLAEVAESGSYDVSSAALRSLVRIGTPDAEAALLDIIEVGPTDTAIEAIATLPRLDHPDVLAALLWAADERPRPVREAALIRLYSTSWHQAPPPLLERARNELAAGAQFPWSGESLSFLMTHGTDADRAAVETTMMAGPAHVRAEYVWRLTNDPSPRASKQLLSLLEDPSRDVRNAAMHGLVGRGDAIEAQLERRLLERLEDGGSTGDIEQVLVNLGSERAVDILVDRVEHGTTREWGTALAALSHNRQHAGRLAEVLDRTDDPVRKQQLYSALLFSPGIDTTDIATRALSEDNPDLRAEAAHALGRSGTDESRAKLQRLLEDSSPYVASSALSALGSMGGDGVESTLIASLDDPDLAYTALSALQNVGSPTAREAILRTARHSDDSMLRASALHQLANNPTADTEALLVDAVGADDPEVRTAAISALQTLGTRGAADAMVGLLASDDDTAVQAAWAVRAMGGPAAQAHDARIEQLIGASDFVGEYEGCSH